MRRLLGVSRSVARCLGVSALVVALATVGCGTDERDLGADDPSVAEGERSAEDGDADASARTFTVADLNGIVLAATAPPPGTEHMQTFEGDEALDFVTESIGSAELEDAVEVGFLGGRAAMFGGPNLEQVVLSWGAVYENPAAAGAAMQVYVRELAANLGFDGPEQDPGLGQQGAILRGAPDDAPQDAPYEEIHYIWRIGNLLLSAAGAPYDEAGLGRIAEATNSRAG